MELRRLALTCEFGNFLDEALCDRFVCGLLEEAIQRRLLAEADLTLTKALSLAQSMEIAQKDLKEIHPTRAEVKTLQESAHYVSSRRQLNCHRCLGAGHSPGACRFKSAKCNKCHKTGHITKACLTTDVSKQTRRKVQSDQNTPQKQQTKKKTTTAHQIELESSSQLQSEVVDIVHVHTVSPDIPRSYNVVTQINDIPITMELDTGAGVSIVSKQTWSDKLKQPKLQPCSLRLQSYPSKPLDVLGVCTVKVTIKDNTVSLPLVVIKGDGISLPGRNWLEQIKLDWHEIAKINGITKPSYQKKLDDLLKQYEEIFRDELGKCKQIKAKLHVKPNTVPKFYRPRPIPLALKEKVEEDLNRLERLGVISKVETSEWATPTVPVRKPNGSVHLCGDYKVTINPYLNVNQYPLPRPEELFATLNNGQHFTKLDLSEAYLQIELDDDAKKYLVINTHKGLYRFNRLPYGIASAPAIFQQSIEQVLPKLPKVVCYMDDILITGRTDKEHLQNLTSVFESIRQHGLRIKLSKCKFFQESVEYLGHIVSKDGIHTSKKKIKAITDVPAPTDVSKLRSFLGMVNHYGKFVKSLTELNAPLNKLLRKDEPWNWTEECQTSFLKIKDALTSTDVLAHYDPSLPLGLACDASSVGVGAVLFHKYPDGSERPIAYASKSLTSAEKHYSQIEQEALSIIFGVKKYHQFLYGQTFLLLTDHKPLLTIFGQKKGILTMAASRLQRWAIILSAYTYSIAYKPTKEHGNADCLSRLPQETDPEFETFHAYEPVVNLIQERKLNCLPLSADMVKKETEKDTLLSQVMLKINQGWPSSSKNLPKELHPYFHRKLQLTVHNGCILLSHRVVIPSSLRQQVLTEIHEGHMGIVRMKSLARMHVWWPKIDENIETHANQCISCQENSQQPNKAPVLTWENPKEPWKRLHVDFTGPYEGSMWLIVIDAATK